MSNKGPGAMSEENSEKSALVPRLRFPKFSEVWRADRVGKIAEIFKGKGIAKSDISDDGLHSCIRYGELYTVYGELVTKVFSKTSLPATDLFFGEPNDVIIPSSGESKEDIATAACVIPGGIAFGGDLNVLRTKENGAFLSYYLNGPLRKGIARVAQGDTVVHLYPHQIEKLPIAVPGGSEQQKIADCLSSLDELITAETQKLDALKTYKKGLMQQLFPREGETVPRLRLPEFREAGEWEQKVLADVCLRITNGKANAEDHEDDGLYPLYDRSEVVKQSSEFVFDDEAVIIPGEGMRFQPKYYKGKFNLHQRAYALMQHQGNARFVYYTMDRFKDVLAKNAVKSTVLSLRLPIIERFGLAVPSTAEQQKIADCLSSLDELITAETQMLDALKTHKTGLMQQLFPVLDEVQA